MEEAEFTRKAGWRRVESGSSYQIGGCMISLCLSNVPVKVEVIFPTRGRILVTGSGSGRTIGDVPIPYPIR